MAIASTEDLFRAMGIGDDALAEEHRISLDQRGFAILPPNPEYLASAGIDLDTVRETLDHLTEREQWRGGWEGMEEVIEREPGRMLDPGSNRLANLIDKHPCFVALATMPDVLAAARHLIEDEFRLSGFDMREPQKGSGEQKIHIDWLPRETEDETFNCLVCGMYLDGMTKDSGPVRVVPGSHRLLGYPENHIDTTKRHPEEIQVEVEPGARVIFNALLWHAGGKNRGGRRRRTLYIEYRKRGIPQLLNQKRYLSDETKARLTEEQTWLLGVGRDDPLDATSCYGPGQAYREKYPGQSAHILSEVS